MESRESFKGQTKVSKNQNPQEKEEFRIAFGFPLGPRLGFGLTFSQLWTSNSEDNWSHRGKHHKFVKIRVESRIQYLVKSKAIVAIGYAGATIFSRALGRSPPFALRRLECFLLALLEPPATHSRQFKAQQKRKKKAVCMDAWHEHPLSSQDLLRSQKDASYQTWCNSCDAV